jgi:hypothetical protein
VLVVYVVVDDAVDGEIQLPGIAPGPEVIIVVIVVDARMALPLGRTTIGIPLIVVVVSEETVGMVMVLPPMTTEPEVGVYRVPQMTTEAGNMEEGLVRIVTPRPF